MGGGKYSNITWHPSLSRAERNSLRKQQGFTLWFTGLSASGKSTVATALEQHLLHLGLAAYRLDGDNVRFGLNKDLGFSDKDRTENIRRIGEVRVTVPRNPNPLTLGILPTLATCLGGWAAVREGRLSFPAAMSRSEWSRGEMKDSKR